MSSSRDEDRQQALSHHPQQDLVPPASRPSPPGDASMGDNVGSSHLVEPSAGAPVSEGVGGGVRALLAFSGNPSPYGVSGKNEEQQPEVAEVEYTRQVG